jgi:hypothetical protein
MLDEGGALGALDVHPASSPTSAAETATTRMIVETC